MKQEHASAAPVPLVSRRLSPVILNLRLIHFVDAEHLHQ